MPTPSPHTTTAAAAGAGAMAAAVTPLPPPPAAAAVPHPFPPSSPPLPSDLSASSLLSELSASVQQCERLDVELNALLSERSRLEQVVSSAVPGFLEEVEAMRVAQRSISSTVAASSQSAQALAAKVRQLDLAASNVGAAVSRVESVLSLRNSIARVREKLASGSLVGAADDLYRCLFLNPPIENDLSFHLLCELERKVREEVDQQAKERYVRQARNFEAQAASASQSSKSSQVSPLESRELLKLSRVWPKLGFNYRGLIMYAAQVRHECLALIHRSGWSLHSQVEGAVIDYPRLVGRIIECVNGFIVKHLLTVQATFGPGSQLRLLQELLKHVIDGEVATKLLGRFMEDKKIREPPRGSQQPAEDICSRIKQINQRVLASQHGRGGGGSDGMLASYFNPHNPTPPHPLLDTQLLDELLDEIKALSSDMENFIRGINSLARQASDFLEEAVNKEREEREEEERKQGMSEEESRRREAAFSKILSNPQDLSSLPSVHQQHGRVMTLLQRMLREDKDKKNLMGIPLSEEKHNMFAQARPALPPDQPIPPHQLHLPPTSPFLIHGFGLDPSLSTSSHLYDVQLTLIGKYVLLEEYYMNVNVEKAVAIDEHEGRPGASFNFEPEQKGEVVAGGNVDPTQDDLEAELEAAEQKAKERERQALGAGAGLHSFASAAITTLHSGSGGVDPYLYLTGLGGALSGAGLPPSFLRRFSSHKTSSVVDNVCFLYKKCIQRAIKTSNRDAIYSILLRVHENFSRKLSRVYESTIAQYEAHYGSRKKSSLSYALHSNPAAYLFPSSSARSNLLGQWVSSAASGMSVGTPSATDVRKKVAADVALLLTVNNIDSTLENMQALVKYVEQTLEDMFGEESTQEKAAAAARQYSHGLSLEQLREKVSDFHSSFHSFDHLIYRSLQLISDNCWLRLLPRLSLLQLHANELYACPELSTSSSDRSDLILGGFMEIFRRDIVSLDGVLNENNFYQLVFQLINLTVRFLEGMVLPKSNTRGGAGQAGAEGSGGAHRPIVFTQSGGVQFDKQIRTLTSFFTNDIAANLERHFAHNFFLYLHPRPNSAAATSATTSAAAPSSLLGLSMQDSSSSSSSARPWRVSFSGSAQARQLFSKLGHVASILSVDKPAEVLEYTERELFNLSKDEVRRILSLRKEFSDREIQQLKL